MLFSVVIPTCQRYAALRTCLDGLRPETQSVGASEFEVIVSDDTRAELRQIDPVPSLPFVRFLEGPRRGPASNRNRGAVGARGEWLIFLDDDIIPQPGLLRAYADAIATHPGYGVFEGRTAADRPKARMDEESPVTEAGGFLWSCNFAIRRDLFQKLHGFCEAFPYAMMEDVDFRLRLTAVGEGFLHVPNATVIHPWRTMKAAPKLMHMHFCSARVLFSRHPRERPSFLGYFRIIARNIWIDVGEGRMLGYRGFWRWFWNRFYFTLADLGLAWDALLKRAR